MEKERILFNIVDGINNQEQEVYYDEFECISVFTNSEKESNDLLHSIWREVDEVIPFKNQRCPWMYIPHRTNKNGKSYLLFGIMNTAIGEIMWLCSYEKKGTIDEIGFLPYHEIDRTNEKVKQIREIVEKGIQRKNELYVFTVKCRVSGIYQDNNCYMFESYVGDNFMISNEENSSVLIIVGQAHSCFEFCNRMTKQITNICDFLSMETNTIVGFDDLEVFEGNRYEKEKAIEGMSGMICVSEEFIDLIPVTQENKLLLQKNAVYLIDQYINYEKCDVSIKNIFKSANIFREGLELEYLVNATAFDLTDTTVKFAVKRNETSRSNMLSSAISFYMSALENLTTLDANPEQCKECGQLKYGITSRVGEIAKKHFNPYMEKVMKRIYSMRSKYFHTANAFIKNDNTFIIPEINESEDIGCQINGFSSIMIDGESHLISASNVREWTSYIIRKESTEIFPMIK